MMYKYLDNESATRIDALVKEVRENIQGNSLDVGVLTSLIRQRGTVIYEGGDVKRCSAQSTGNGEIIRLREHMGEDFRRVILTHELGHLILGHSHSDKDTKVKQDEADYFAMKLLGLSERQYLCCCLKERIAKEVFRLFPRVLSDELSYLSLSLGNS